MVYCNKTMYNKIHKGQKLFTVSTLSKNYKYLPEHRKIWLACHADKQKDVSPLQRFSPIKRMQNILLSLLSDVLLLLEIR